MRGVRICTAVNFWPIRMRMYFSNSRILLVQRIFSGTCAKNKANFNMFRCVYVNVYRV